MWTREFFGMDVYHLLMAFFMYSVLGWFVESIYMSICNKKITNRGFGKGPFCPIYGFGALIGYIILSPLSDNVVALYLVGAVSATIFEFLVGITMKRLFGEVWWDYNDKPFNYKGILCLESTIAWGFYAVLIVKYLHVFIMNLIDKAHFGFGKFLVFVLFAALAFDYTIQICRILKIDMKEQRTKLINKYTEFKARWY